MRVNIDADGTQATGGFALVPEGEYFIKVSEKKDGMTKSKRQKVDLLFNIEDAHGSKLGSCWHTLTFIPKNEPGHGMMLYANRCLGMPFDGQLDFDTDEYLYRSCKALVVQDTYEGKTKNKVKYFITDEIVSSNGPAPNAQPAPASVTNSDGQPLGEPPAEFDKDSVPF